MTPRTRRYPGPPTFVLHTLVGTVDERAAAHAAHEALEEIRQLVADGLPVYVVLDLRQLDFADLASHRTWSSMLRAGWPRDVSSKIAVLGPPTSTFAAEREALRSERLEFFTDLEAAQAWLERSNEAEAPA